MGLDGLNEILLRCSWRQMRNMGWRRWDFGIMVLFANSNQGMSSGLSKTSVGILDNSLYIRFRQSSS